MSDDADNTTQPTDNTPKASEPTPAITPPSRGSRWPKGFSGNPTGRPKLKGEAREAMELAQKYGKKAVRRLAQLMRSTNERVAVSAATALLDRGFGRPAQQITGANGAPLIPASLMGAGPISDALSAAAAYAAILGDATIDLSQITFAQPAPSAALIFDDASVVAEIEPVTPAPVVDVVIEPAQPIPPPPTESPAEAAAAAKRDRESMAILRGIRRC